MRCSGPISFCASERVEVTNTRPGADPLGLGDDRLPGRHAEHDALLRGDVEGAGGEPGVGIAHENSAPTRRAQ